MTRPTCEVRVASRPDDAPATPRVCGAPAVVAVREEHATHYRGAVRVRCDAWPACRCAEHDVPAERTEGTVGDEDGGWTVSRTVEREALRSAKHAGDAGVTADVRPLGDGVAWHMRYPTGYALGDDVATALRRALGHTRCALANAARLREMHAGAPCSCGVGEGTGHAWSCERRWAVDVAREVAGMVRGAVP